MTSIDLVKKLSLEPRAVVLTGTLRERNKNSDAGVISGFMPHYTVKGCPVVQIDGAGEIMPGAPEAAAIEADFSEQHTRPELAAISGGYGRPLNMVHLIFGRQGTAPNSAEAAVLREAGEIFKRNVGRPALLVAVPVLAAGQYGVALGRLCPLGLFSDAGEALWLHPLAAGTLLQAEFPAHQTQRALTPKPKAPLVVTPPPAPEPHWYEKLSALWAKKSPGLTPAKLHALVIEKYVDYLVDFGGAKNKTEATAIAKREFAEFSAAKNPPVPLPASSGSAQAQAQASAPGSKPKLSAARV